jgi:hypothetical protein
MLIVLAQHHRFRMRKLTQTTPESYEVGETLSEPVGKDDHESSDGVGERVDKASGLRRSVRWLGVELSKATMPAVIAGVVALLVSLVTNHIQNQDQQQQTHTEHQRQAVSELQVAATADLNITSAIVRFQDQCAGPTNSRKDCAALAPDLDAWRQAETQLLAVRVTVADPDTQSLALQLDDLCTHAVDAETQAESNQLFDHAVGTYVDLNHRIGAWLSGS